jgi:hypothetical protein
MAVVHIFPVYNLMSPSHASPHPDKRQACNPILSYDGEEEKYADDEASIEVFGLE